MKVALCISLTFWCFACAGAADSCTTSIAHANDTSHANIRCAYEYQDNVNQHKKLKCYCRKNCRKVPFYCDTQNNVLVFSDSNCFADEFISSDKTSGINIHFHDGVYYYLCIHEHSTLTGAHSATCKDGRLDYKQPRCEFSSMFVLYWVLLAWVLLVLVTSLICYVSYTRDQKTRRINVSETLEL